MGYALSASRLQTYQRCPQAYYFQYERHMSNPIGQRAASLGWALHQTLATLYRDWSYSQPMPWSWVMVQWKPYKTRLTPFEYQDGEIILQRYYAEYLQSDMLRKPVAVEGRIQGTLLFDGIEFSLKGRYDRLDWFEDGLALVDYKSAKSPQVPAPDAVDVQLGLYALALGQHYQQSLKQVSLVFLRTGNVISFAVTDNHQAKVRFLIQDLALRLHVDQDWNPCTGTHCKGCSYKAYCPAVNPDPAPLPSEIQSRPAPPLQLALTLFG
ncbi:PD-(D/E)XK nuclease family protein [Synechococcus sp. PCC 6312]|uniref:RecB family exonuclease n=1 Tax=Synechococcus sp. (strain ATCC 27167 / PCC 6312) TaxID=195253 RepID=UPI00029F222F|nr:PD-(D/E)XK nuclease family protein [Synechococcus sp. PCC 6312]AFY60861.1 protein of unknown function DUF83 [Synechococcus sp. PCC 6312]